MPRVIGAMSEGDFLRVMDMVQVDGQPPTPVQTSTAELFGRACRVASGTQLRESESKAARDKIAAEAHALALAEAAKPSTSTAIGPARYLAKAAKPSTSTAIGPAIKGRQVKLSTIINQTSELEVGILDPMKLKQAYRRYFEVFKREPPPDK